jgi:hypothetical protein
MDLQKTVSSATGFKQYLHVSDTDTFYEGTRQIIAKWTDSEGNIWYKTLDAITKGGTIAGYKLAALHKFSKSATVWEEIWTSPSNDQEIANPTYPTKIDPTDSMHYSIYNRVGN